MGLIDTPKGPTGANKAKAAVAIISGLACLTPFLLPLKAEVISLSVLQWYLTVAFGMYGLQFLLVPAIIIDQNVSARHRPIQRNLHTCTQLFPHPHIIAV